MRTFEDKPATREQVPLLIGLVGASGSGKTYSALRLAAGIQRVSGGEIGFIDTEAKRALYYADAFKFRHLDFKAPFGPLDYLAAIRHFYDKGAKTIIIDSMSHEHEGPGGVLEQHETETQRLVKAWSSTPDKVKMSAWQVPKAARRRLLNEMLQMSCNFILCFRAKEKVDLTNSAKPAQLGWMPVAGEEFVYEMSLNCLLMPGSGGVPSWQPSEKGEKAIIKLPGQFRSIFSKNQPLSEDIGEELAKWAAGGVGTFSNRLPDGAGGPSPAGLQSAIKHIQEHTAFTDDEFTDVMERLAAAPDKDSAAFIGRENWKRMTKPQQATVTKAISEWETT